MKSLGKKSVLGVMIDAVDYDAAIDRIIRAAHEGQPCILSALAVHGTMTGVLDARQRYRLNRFDLLVPDGQPVRWALNLLYNCRLTDRVYGPELTLRLFSHAARAHLPVYLYGTTDDVLQALRARLRARFPDLKIAGSKPSQFRLMTESEKTLVVREIIESGARIVFVALGCPRQEIWAYEYRDCLSMPIAAVGAAFPFIAGTLSQAPSVLQQYGLEWLFRLFREPRRLWRRYVFLNPYYLYLLALQALGRNFDSTGNPPEKEVLIG